MLVSTTVRPVTQTADVAVNNASISEELPRCDQGSDSSAVPTVMVTAKAAATT